jgi:hypothetical protein
MGALVFRRAVYQNLQISFLDLLGQAAPNAERGSSEPTLWTNLSGLR